jgi:outer membrane murein-binding lipoprotein Lpp
MSFKKYCKESFMKKMVVIVAALCAVLFLAGCVSAPPASEGMANAKSSAPAGTLVGQATAPKGASKDETMKKSESNAKYQLVRGMSAMVKSMLDEAVAEGRVPSGEADEFFRGVETSLSRAALSSAVKAGQGEGAGGAWFTVLYMDKAEVVKQINTSVNASKQANPGAAAFTTDNIDNAYNTYAAREWKN